ncbi:hypothetical protein [Corallincola spongiicola]|uniref:Uncharacterized protein n=1 Tax=Corallincola spongiicola TaxID=2520508 RepID=A0ABY1WUC8_9GAMM|nr:hypothetical protein [Corallincola spongiicola]TAA48354.1 hypothetical protein EXY25_03745 [Corallincola spongiicola]
MNVRPQVEAWLNKCNIPFTSDVTEYLEDVDFRYEVEEVLYGMAKKNTSTFSYDVEAFDESFYQDLLQSYLTLAGKEWEFVCSEDVAGDAAVKIIMQKGSEQREIVAGGIEFEGDFPASLHSEMEKFTRKHAKKTVLSFHCDESVELYGCSHEQADELIAIFKKLK